MLETFKSNRASTFLITTVLSITLFSSLFFISQDANNQALNRSLLLQFTIDSPKWFQYTISFLLYVLAVWYANFVVIKHQILGRGNHLAGFFVLVLLAIGPNLLFENLIALSSLLIIRFFDRCFKIQKSAKPNPLIFDASFITAMLCMVYVPFVLLLLLVWIAALYSGGFNFKGWLLSIISLFITLYLAQGVLFLFDLSYFPTLTSFSFQLNQDVTTVNQVFYYSFLALVLIATPTSFSVLRFSKVILRNHLNLIFWSIPVFTIIFITTHLKIGQVSSFLFFPLSIILGQYFIKLKNKKLANLVLVVILILVIGFQLYRIIQPL